MSKLKQLRRKMVKDVVMALGIVAVFGVLLLLTGMLADSAQQKKTTASNALSQDQTQLANLNNQFNKSGTSEKRFVEIALAHPNPDFSAGSDAIKDLLRKAKDKYRFGSNLKLTLAPDKVVEKPEFSGLNYDIMVRDPMRIELDAISDMHVFSFLDELTHNAPGLVRINKLDLTRKGDMDAAALSGMNNGDAPALVSATIEFTWVGITPKPAAPAKPAVVNP